MYNSSSLSIIKNSVYKIFPSVIQETTCSDLIYLSNYINDWLCSESAVGKQTQYNVFLLWYNATFYSY